MLVTKNNSQGAAIPVGRGRLEQLLDELLDASGAPGAVLAVHADGVTTRAAAGTTEAGSPPVTTATLFALGSTMKVFTASLVMQLVEGGVLDLAETLADTLPELRLARPDLAREITVAHLLGHTSGLEGEIEVDGGRGDDALARMVAELEPLPSIHPPGAMYSYCNLGYNLLGRIVEKTTRQPFNDALRTRLLAPLGASSVALFPEEAILGSVAIGHEPDPSGALTRIPEWHWIRAAMPAGESACGSVDDLMTLARLHLGERPEVLSDSAVLALQQSRVPIPDRYDADQRSLGWFVHDNPKTLDLSHGGNNAGCLAVLRVLPELRAAIVLLVNATTGLRHVQLLVRHVLDDLGVPEPEPGPVAGAEPRDMERYVGTYRRGVWEFDVQLREGALVIGPSVLSPTSEVTLQPTGPDVFSFHTSIYDEQVPLVFLGEGPSADYLQVAGRAFPRAHV